MSRLPRCIGAPSAVAIALTLAACGGGGDDTSIVTTVSAQPMSCTTTLALAVAPTLLTPFQIMLAKVWSMALVVLVCSGFALTGVIGGRLAVPVAGSVPLFLAGTAARSMP